MRTTIELPDALFRQVKARAAIEGVTLKDLISRYVESGLRRSKPPTTGSPRRRSELPVARSATGPTMPDLTNAELYQILERDEVDGGRPD